MSTKAPMLVGLALAGLLAACTQLGEQRQGEQTVAEHSRYPVKSDKLWPDLDLYSE